MKETRKQRKKDGYDERDGGEMNRLRERERERERERAREREKCPPNN